LRTFNTSDSGSYQPQLLDILADENYTVALLHAKARHGHKILDQDYAFLMRIDSGQIAESQEA
jgi:ketosteroid isomerase-like protein